SNPPLAWCYHRTQRRQSAMTKNTMNISEECLSLASKDGSIELRDGVVLNSQANIIAEQSGWDVMDEAKSLDFTKAPFWVTADDGARPASITDARDLAGFLDEHEIEVSDARVLAGAQSRELQGRSASFIECK